MHAYTHVHALIHKYRFKEFNVQDNEYFEKNSLGNGALINSMLSSEVDKAISKPKRNKEYLAWMGLFVLSWRIITLE